MSFATHWKDIADMLGVHSICLVFFVHAGLSLLDGESQSKSLGGATLEEHASEGFEKIDHLETTPLVITTFQGRST